jgi:branched-chain amino acid transport system permease protein
VDILQATLNGLLIGGIFALISIGLTLVFGVMDIVNFAHGEFLMLGMFGAWVASTYLGVDPLIAAPAVGLLVFLIGAVLERATVEQIIHAPPLAQVFATVGLGILLQNGAAMLFGNDFRSVKTGYQTQTLELGSIGLSVPYLLAFAYALVVAVGLNLFLQRTEFGRAMRATAQNRSAAVLLGIDPRRMYMVAFGLGVGLTGMAGAVILPYTVTYPTVGLQYVLIMFTVVVLGGLGSVRGAMVAGLFIGVVQSVSTVFLSTELQNLVVFAVFYAALILGPGGVVKRVRIRQA